MSFKNTLKQNYNFKNKKNNYDILKKYKPFYKTFKKFKKAVKERVKNINNTFTRENNKVKDKQKGD